jgi:uncharacterized integral membrane protein
MSTRRPFTLIAAAIFLIMALVHLYRLVTNFQVIFGSHVMPIAISYFAIVITGILAVMLYRESQT